MSFQQSSARRVLIAASVSGMFLLGARPTWAQG